MQMKEKSNQTVLEVHLDAVIHNLNYFRSKLKPTTKTMCMIKAFGYGVGSYELARTLYGQGVDYVGVALVDEGVELRQEGITMPILILNPEEHGLNDMFDYDLEPEVYNQKILDAIIQEAERRGISDYPVHIKLDTGMHRMGFDVNDIPMLAKKLNAHTCIKVKSVFSHLAGSDSSLLDDYTKQQIALFTTCSNQLEQLLGYSFLRHLCNSAGIERFPEAHFDMVRLGIGLYGISALDNKFLEPMATLKTRILQIRELRKGETVGYSRKGVLTRDSRIACLPIGYADGLNRLLSNGKGKVFINGEICPIIGNICMDISMIDITDVPAKEGDEVIIFGKEITISDLAHQLETIPYEILTSIAHRVKRVYT